MKEQIAAVGTRLLAETMTAMASDWDELTTEGMDNLLEITTLMAEAGIRSQMGEDVSIMVNACQAAIGNWESVSLVKAADRSDAIAASVKAGLLVALEIVFAGAGVAIKAALV